MAGNDAPRENMNAAINTTDSRPRVTSDLPESWKSFAQSPVPVAPASPDVPMVAPMPIDQLHRILAAFENPETATPFDDALRDLILQDPNGVEFRKAYGPSGSR